MLNSIVSQLLENEDEKIWLEYKSYWYWPESDTNKIGKGWGEFLKDFAALFNSEASGSGTKYFIIGFDETTKLTQNFKIDINDKNLSIFNDLPKFKNTLIKKLKNSFRSIPEYNGSHSLDNIESFFEVCTTEIKGHEVLVIRVGIAPYILELTKLLQGNESFREGSIPVRKNKPDGSPENVNASRDESSILISKIKSQGSFHYPLKETSIEKVVELFKAKFFPNSTINCPIKEISNTSGLRYEIFEISGEYVQRVNFIYFTAYTTQTKSFQDIKARYSLKEGKTILLTDELNKRKGQVDKNRLKQMFSAECSDIEVYYLEEFALKKLYSDLFDPDIFHQGGFNINDYIQPYTTISHEKTADILLAEWYQSENAPLLVVKGAGGIGKTTVVKHFLDSIHKNNKDSTNILFISSHEIINEIMRNPKIDNIFDFYQIVAEKNDVQNRFNRNLLELSVDHGDLIIALDGIDEVIAKIGTKFNIAKLIESIFTGYSENLAKTKVIITCRDYFWSEEIVSSNIDTISLLPFDKVLANKYFSKHFKEPSKVKKAMAQADSFALSNEGEDIFIPYVLDMIKDNLLSNVSSKESKSSSLLKLEHTNDYLIFKVCEREIIKLNNTDIDKQVELFIYIAHRFNGVVHSEHFNQVNNAISASFTEAAVDKFKAHPLLAFDTVNNTLQFRYDFFNEYFKVIALVRFFNSLNIDSVEDDIINIIKEYLNYDGSFVFNVKERLSREVKDSLKDFIWEFINSKIKELNYFSDYDLRKVSSALFTFLLSISESKDRKSNTNLLKLIHGNGADQISDFNLIDLHPAGNIKPTFDFSDLEFKNCYFENYEYFSACNFNSKSCFKDSWFKKPLHRSGLKTNLSAENFQTDSCDTSGLGVILDEIVSKSNDNQEDIGANLKKVLSLFWSNSSFREKLVLNIHRQTKHRAMFFSRLIECEVILSKYVKSKNSKPDKKYYINPKYSNLRKIMEENDSCLEFEQIVELLS
ncbi:NACHT domain-containing protein [Pseudoalteromonas sp. SWYJZ19]|uniref:NACHT domain-containing protein n=1 Tax=Pseudoalteromonas sp. SWYJZ19 TaxID=2792068 RepID=UPI0018CD3CC3|nr:NACHT domain-containing protein [Pseudoalteromonas sp. SWYJZ19]MBH0050556.1 NACHT domain-containing protein [Pseudoalteromonas sp. SWYJZ19]